jgi:hypothetical protein
MCMDFLINESQLNFLVESENTEKFTRNMKQLNSFTVNLINKAKRIFGLNFKFLITWGPVIGGFVGPLDKYIRENYLEFSEDSIILITLGIACTYFYQNKKETKKLYEQIEKEGLVSFFEEMLLKSKQLKDSFVSFMESLNLTLGTTVEMIHYSFLIPIINDLQQVAHGATSIANTSKIIVERLLTSGVVLIAGQILIDVISKILKRFKR